MSNQAKQSLSAALRWLSLGSVAGPVLFTSAWFVLGLVSTGFALPDRVVSPYSAVSHPISGLGLGATGPFMNAAFVAGGLLCLVGVVAALQGIDHLSARERWTASALLGLSGLGMIMDGFFTLESFGLHMLGFLFAAAAPVVGFVVLGVALRRHPAWRRLGGVLLVAGPLNLLLVVVALATFDPVLAGEGRGMAGLTQRIWALHLHAGFVALGWSAFSSFTKPAVFQH